MSKVRHITVSEDDDGQRLDRWLKKNVPDLPFGLTQKLIRKGQVRVDGKRVKADTKLVVGQDVRIPPHEYKVKGEKRKLGKKDIEFIKSLVIYEDEHIFAINKPEGLASQGGTNTTYHLDGLLEGLTNSKGVKPRLVHRLDKDTSGIMLLARSSKIAKILGDQFKGRSIKKIYWALVSPAPAILEGEIDAPLAKMDIGRGGREKEMMHVDTEEGKKAFTDYITLDSAAGKIAFVAFWPKTGRTHQIRVHSLVMGSPILGDNKYYDPEAEPVDGLDYAQRLHLHAQRLIFAHPITGKRMDISAPLPPELIKSWKAFGFDTKFKADPFEE